MRKSPGLAGAGRIHNDEVPSTVALAGTISSFSSSTADINGESWRPSDGFEDIGAGDDGTTSTADGGVGV